MATQTVKKSKMLLVRSKIPSSEEGVLGVLSFGENVLYTLEPNQTKPFHVGHPCVKEGTYPIQVTQSMKFKRKLPEVLKVLNRAGIRIHSGDSIKDTLGCILPFARTWPAGRGTSRTSENKITSWCMDQLVQGNTIELEIRWE